MEATNNTTIMTNIDNGHLKSSRPNSPFSQYEYFIIEVTLRICVSGFLALSGVVSNTINMIIFYRQGILSHSSTVNLAALALSDFLSCLLFTWGVILGILEHFVDTTTWSWNIGGFFVHMSGRPYNTITIITSSLTTYLAFERAMSVVFPFKAKTIFTPKRSLAVVIVIFVGTVILNIPSNFEYSPTWLTRQSNNVSYLSFSKSDMPQELIMFFFYTNPVTLRFVSIIIVVLCNFIIFWKVHLSQKFRTTSAPKTISNNVPVSSHAIKNTTNTNKESQDQDNTVNNNNTHLQQQQNIKANSTKEMRLLRMITLISVIYVICYMTSVIHVTCLYLVWELYVDYHWHLDMLVFYVVSVFQLLNASTNIIIYYRMSSRYREELLLCCGKK